MGELDDPVVVQLPLRGEWSVEGTPAYRIPSDGTDLLGQRYAYDLVRTDKFAHAVHQTCLAHLLRRVGELLADGKRGQAKTPTPSAASFKARWRSATPATPAS